MSSNPTIAVVLLNWNNYEDTASCLRSLLDLEYDGLSIYVVDNGSTDGSLQKLISEFSRPEFIKLESNQGFAGGNNVAIESALNNGAEFIWLLNNDTIVDGLSLERIVSIFESNSDIGIVSPKIYHYPEKNIVWFEQGNIDWSIGVGFHTSYEGEQPFHTENQYIPFCSVFIQRDVFDDIGYLPEHYFLYMEDVDFCTRAKEAGYQLCTDMESAIFHKVSTSTGSTHAPLASYYVSRNSLLILKKFRQHRSKLSIGIYTWWIGTRLLYRVITGELESAKAWTRGLWDGLRNKTGRGPYP